MKIYFNIHVIDTIRLRKETILPFYHVCWLLLDLELVKTAYMGRHVGKKVTVFSSINHNH